MVRPAKTAGKYVRRVYVCVCVFVRACQWNGAIDV